jgi:tyrosinase
MPSLAFTCRNVFELSGDWADAIPWYARGVKVLKSLAPSESTSWRFLGAIYGFDSQMWQQVGYLDPSEEMPA